MKQKTMLLVGISTILLLSSTTIYANSINVITFKTENGIKKEIPTMQHKETEYIDLESVLKMYNLSFEFLNDTYQVNINGKTYIFEKNKSYVKVLDEKKELLYPLVVEKVHVIKDIYASKNGLSILNADNTLYIPIETLENPFIFNQDLIRQSTIIETKTKENMVYNYDYKNSFDDIDLNFEDGQTAKYSVLDKKYNQLAIGTEVRPSPVTGFSIKKPSYGFGSDTIIYKPSKGNAKADGWVAPKITSPYTTNKKKQAEIMQLELGLINGDYMFVDELGNVISIDYTTLDNGVAISAKMMSKDGKFNEFYRQKAILSEVLAYYIKDNNIVDKIVNEYLYFDEVYKDNRIVVNEKIEITQSNYEMITYIQF